MANLAHYSYSGKDNSFIGNYILPKYFVFVMSICPLWIAPNLLTFIGLLCNIASYTIIALTEDPVKGPPWWACVLFSVLLWIYMTLDWIDGKQARRTGTSSPLGELFDHVCDASSLCLFTTSIGSIMMAGPVYTLIILLVALIPFYLAHWEEYYCGELILGVFDNPTEAEVLFMTIGIISAAAKPTVWQTVMFTVHDTEITVNKFIILLSVLGMFSTVARNVWKVINAKPHRPGVKLTTVFAELLPLATLVVLTICWAISSTSLLVYCPRLFVITVGYTFAYLVSRLIVQRICKEEPKLFYPVLLLLYIAVLISVIKWFVHQSPDFMGSSDPEYIYLWVYFGIIMSVFLTLCVSLILQLTSHLNISCFTIPHHSSHEHN